MFIVPKVKDEYDDWLKVYIYIFILELKCVAILKEKMWNLTLLRCMNMQFYTLQCYSTAENLQQAQFSHH